MLNIYAKKGVEKKNAERLIKDKMYKLNCYDSIN